MSVTEADSGHQEWNKQGYTHKPTREEVLGDFIHETSRTLTDVKNITISDNGDATYTARVAYSI